jgi:hypothetical protein
MKNLILFLLMIATLTISCSKQSQSDLLPNQTVNFGVGSDFQIRMPGAMSSTIQSISLNGSVVPAGSNDVISLVFLPKGSEFCDTITVGPDIRIQNLNPMYFRNIDGTNVLIGRILVNKMVLKNLVFSGNLSFVYNQYNP